MPFANPPTPSSRPDRPAPRHAAAVAAVVAASLLLAACGDRADKDKSATQTAAKVNKEEITVHQINYFLGQQRSMPPEQAASSGRQVLERLIDQELVLQKAAEQKLDRDPKVAQQVEATRRDVIVKAYVDKLGREVPKPSASEVLAYYQAHPALFRERRLYNLREVSIEATGDQVGALKVQLDGARTFADFVAALKPAGYKFAGAEAVRAAEQLPLADLDKYAALKDGQTMFSTRPGGVLVTHLVQSRSQPIAEAQATAVIEQFLLNERRRKLVADDLEALRKAAKIEYVGQFVGAVPPPPPPRPSNDAPPVTTLQPTLPASAVDAAPQVDVVRPAGEAASMPSGELLDKGLKGMK